MNNSQEEKILKIIFYFTIGYLFLFTLLAVFQGNYEFLYYTVIFSILLLVIVFVQKKVHFPISMMIGSTIVGVLHFTGGLVHLPSGRLYDLWIIPEIFKYDNLIHLLATFFVTFAVYSLLYPHLYKDIRHNKFILAFIFIAMAGGISAFNEILELIAVEFFDAAEQVGDYYNNAYDLIFNFAGALAACAFLIPYYHKKHKEK